jgi:hypothetical protein
MIEHKEPFGLRVHLEDDADVRAATRWSESGFWGQDRIDKIEPTRAELSGDINMIDVHLKEPPAQYRSELTEAGEQLVMPDCELDAPQTGAKQGSLF